MNRLVRQEWFRTLFLVLLILGVVLLGFAVVRYLTLSYSIGQNIAYQIHSQGGQADPQTINEAQGLMAADLDLREMLHQQNLALIIGGVGLILLGAGWLGRDLVMSRWRRLSAAAPPAAAH